MNETKSKISSIGKIFLGLVFCSIVSVCIYLGSMIFIYGAWHCPPPHLCETAVWVNIVILLLLISPLFIFAVGAYLCRDAVYDLTSGKYLRIALLAAFASCPVYLLIGIIIFAAVSSN